MVFQHHAFEGLPNFINKLCVPQHIITNCTCEVGGIDTWKTNWQKLITRYYIKQSITQPCCWWQSTSKREIGEIKKDIRKHTSNWNLLNRLWGFHGSYVMVKRTFATQNHPFSYRKNSYELVTDEDPDITLYPAIG